MFFRLLRAWSIGSFGKSLAFNSKRPIKCLSLNNQPCKDRPLFFYTNSDKTLFYPFTSVNKSGGSCNTINDLYPRVCVSNKEKKNMNLKVFNLMSGVNETRFLVQHESSSCKCGLKGSVCNSKQKWNHDKR